MKLTRSTLAVLAELCLEIVEDGLALTQLALDTVNGNGIWCYLNEAAPGPGGEDFVLLHPQRQVLLPEDL